MKKQVDASSYTTSRGTTATALPNAARAATFIQRKHHFQTQRRDTIRRDFMRRHATNMKGA
jgi:hypothetical protein